ncbi:PSD1 and planctomycete cytochrome C domain-containing protein [Planctomicrobium sp. SH527]|uniref:PSD1 and planctomycete cytochrome C domain-containing protein n=1 Tax=Planctomicrobium sp. SH527 TaxID=3448123 RepID=UPI003F5B1049
MTRILSLSEADFFSGITPLANHTKVVRRLVFSLVALIWCAGPSSADDSEKAAFFETKIRPVLVEYCYPCHSGDAGDVQGKLWLDSKPGWEKGGESGPAIRPGNVEESLLIHAIRRSDKDVAMPPDQELPASVVQDFVTWIQQGAFDPRLDAKIVTKSHVEQRELTDRERWVFSSPAKPAVPTVKNADWPQNSIDYFILSKLEAAQLTPASKASPEHLVRRLHFDLTGLPPSPDEVKAFVLAAKVDYQKATSALIDDLLSRPTYGEKWGRYWLDCVRYADSLDARSNGKPGDILDAWRYRDWVVKALNQDLPYNQFVRHQIAGDLLAKQEWNPDLVVATGMYAIGNWGNGDSDKKKVYTDIVDDQIDVTGRAFLGLTLSCARCHDHKFDPISTADYYALSGFFFSSHIIDQFSHPTAGEKLMRIPLLSPEELLQRDQIQTKLKDVEQQLSNGLKPLHRRKDNVAGKPDLVAWDRPENGNPSVTVNRSSESVSFSTITLPGKSACVHPGPSEVVTVVWRSPVAGDVQVDAFLSDADGNCGDGVQCTLLSLDQTYADHTLVNAAKKAEMKVTIAVEPAQLIRLRIAPRAEYTCDSTQVELKVRHAASGQEWRLTGALLDDAQAQQVDKGSFIVCAGDAPLLNQDDAKQAVLLAQQKELKAQLTEFDQCQGLQDGGVPGSEYEGFHDAAIHVRGNYRRLAAVQRRGVPEVFKSEIPPLEGSGRLALADWIASPTHPLTARVQVNRLWQHHFGRGIVATPNNFGVLGTPPSHPELLDWLSTTFVEKGWSLKEMHRMICMSAAYQQSSFSDDEGFQGDVDNNLFSRQTRRKLTAEELRDSLLLSTSQLDRTVGGMSTSDLASGRRTLYLRTIRSDRTTYQLLFDGADPTSIVEQRIDSIVAPQALWLLNDPFVLKQASELSKRFSAVDSSSIVQKLERFYLQLYGRTPTEGEMEAISNYITRNGDSQASWTKICHSLICSNEFMFID